MWGAIAGGVLGAIAGGQKDAMAGHSESSTSKSLQSADDLNKGRSANEALGDSSSGDIFKQMQGLVNAGPGQQAVTDSVNAQNGYADLLQHFMSQSGAPDASQVQQAQNFSSSIFAPQYEQLKQNFVDQNQMASRTAARLGRGGNDPILANKMATEQTRQKSMLNSQQGAYAAQYAEGAPQRQLQLADSLSQVRSGLATQAFSNRQTLMGLGQQLVNSERNYRVGMAGGNTSTSSFQSSGGGFAGAVSGALAGAGTGMKMGAPGGGGGQQQMMPASNSGGFGNFA